MDADKLYKVTHILETLSCTNAPNTLVGAMVLYHDLGKYMPENMAHIARLGLKGVLRHYREEIMYYMESAPMRLGSDYCNYPDCPMEGLKSRYIGWIDAWCELFVPNERVNELREEILNVD